LKITIYPVNRCRTAHNYLNLFLHILYNVAAVEN
jgi:hypothetical protein